MFVWSKKGKWDKTKNGENMGLSIHPTIAFAAHFVSSLGKEVKREEAKTHCKHKKTDVSLKQHKCHKSMSQYNKIYRG